MDDKMPITIRELRLKMEELAKKAAEADTEEQSQLSKIWTLLEDKILSGEQIFELPE